MKAVRRPCLWYNPLDKRVYEWSGWTYDYLDTPYFWSFAPDDHGGVMWTQEPTPTSSNGVDILTDIWGAACTASDANFYALGGAATSYPYESVQGLVEYNFASGSWKN